MQGRQDALRFDSRDMRQTILKCTLLDCYLRTGIDVLHGATSAHPEMAALGFDAQVGLAKNLFYPGNFVGWLATQRVRRDQFAGQGTFDEDDFAIAAGDSTRLKIQRFDFKHGSGS
jgi:hypothetical protein